MRVFSLSPTHLLYSLSQRLIAVVFALLAICTLVSINVYAADVEVTTAKLESTEEGYRVVAAFNFELGHDLKEAINKGVPISFTTEVEMTRPRWYWFDEKTIRSAQTVKIAYDLWTRQYSAAINGGVKQNFPTLDDAMALVLRPRRWLVAEKNNLNAGAIYNVAVRIKLDINQLSKPILITSLSNSDWRLASEWKRFTFKADEK